MPKQPDPKANRLKADGALNPHPDEVSDPLFQDRAFFDPRDFIQVKYEMLRRNRIDGWSKARAAKSFGLSRPTFYESENAVADHGLAGLLPKKRGPRTAHKLSGEILEYIEQRRNADPSLHARALARVITERFGVSIHPRSVERALARKKKRDTLL